MIEVLFPILSPPPGDFFSGRATDYVISMLFPAGRLWCSRALANCFRGRNSFENMFLTRRSLSPQVTVAHLTLTLLWPSPQRPEWGEFCLPLLSFSLPFAISLSFSRTLYRPSEIPTLPYLRLPRALLSRPLSSQNSQHHSNCYSAISHAFQSTQSNKYWGSLASSRIENFRPLSLYLVRRLGTVVPLPSSFQREYEYSLQRWYQYVDPLNRTHV